MKIETPQILWHPSTEQEGKAAPLYSLSILDDGTNDAATTSSSKVAILATAGNTPEVNLWRVRFRPRGARGKAASAAAAAAAAGGGGGGRILQEYCLSSKSHQQHQTNNNKANAAHGGGGDGDHGDDHDAKTEARYMLSLSRLHDRSVNAVKFSPDGRRLAAAGDGGSIVVYTPLAVPNGCCNRFVGGGSANGINAAVSSGIDYNGAGAAAAAAAGSVNGSTSTSRARLWFGPWSNIERESDLSTYVTSSVGSADAIDLSWGCDSTRFAVACLDHSVSVFELVVPSSNNKTGGGGNGGGGGGGCTLSPGVAGTGTAGKIVNGGSGGAIPTTTISGAGTAGSAMTVEKCVGIGGGISTSSPQQQQQQQHPQHGPGQEKWVCVYRNDRDHVHYVQGVSFDPMGVYLSSQGSDRTVRVWARRRPASSSAVAVGDGVRGTDNKKRIDGILSSLLASTKFELGKAKTIKFWQPTTTAAAVASAASVAVPAVSEIASIEGGGGGDSMDINKNEEESSPSVVSGERRDDNNGDGNNDDENHLRQLPTTSSSSDEKNTPLPSTDALVAAADVDAANSAAAVANNNNGSSSGSAAVKSRRYCLYADESTVESFFRRLSWTCDGAFLVTPAALYHPPTTNPNTPFTTEEDGGGGGNGSTTGTIASNSVGKEPAFATYLYARHRFDAPYRVLYGLEKPSIAVRPNPVRFRLPPASASSSYLSDTDIQCRQHERQQQQQRRTTLLPPYRSVFAVLTFDSILIYDTYHSKPLCVARGLHYASLNDAAWTSDGMALVVVSADGYVSFVTFEDGELGEPYDEEDEYDGGRVGAWNVTTGVDVVADVAKSKKAKVGGALLDADEIGPNSAVDDDDVVAAVTVGKRPVIAVAEGGRDNAAAGGQGGVATPSPTMLPVRKKQKKRIQPTLVGACG